MIIFKVYLNHQENDTIIFIHWRILVEETNDYANLYIANFSHKWKMVAKSLNW